MTIGRGCFKLSVIMPSLSGRASKPVEYGFPWRRVYGARHSHNGVT